MSKSHPKVDNAPGIIWRPYQKTRWEARWQARTDLINKGFEPKSERLWTGVHPTEAEAAQISDTCNRLQDAMKIWGRGGIPIAVNPFDGTIRTLINCYQTDPASRYHKKRYSTRRNNDTLLRRIATRHGHEEIRDIKARTILDWYEEWSDHGRMLSTWQAIRGSLRVLFSFGFAILEDPECDRLCRVMSSKALQFDMPKADKQAITAPQAIAVRKIAHDWFGWHCIALGQAFQFEVMLRQRDVIGEWVPLAEPGTSDVTWKGQKWIRGIRWSEIDENFILKHTTSKKQKPLEFDLKLAEMVMEELAFMAGLEDAGALTRDMFPSSGPVILSTVTGAPYDAGEYRRKWRLIANKAGLPKKVKNMHSRHGGVTEAAEYGAPADHIKRAATHSNIKTTEGYIGGNVDANAVANVARIRVAGRNKPKTE